MNKHITSPAGFWPSWISPDLVAGRSVSLSDLKTCCDAFYWLESRPSEGGRTVLVGQALPNAPYDLTPAPYDVGTRVHEYGGGAYAVSAHGEIVFSDRREGGVWLRENGEIRRLGGQAESRYADFAFDPAGGGVFCVREQHGEGEPRASIVWLSAEGQEHVLVEGADFYAAPRPSPDGASLAFIAWNHPDMPWDATKLFLAKIKRNSGVPVLNAIRVLAGAETPCSVIEPVWETNGSLLANSDAHIGWRPIRFRPENAFRPEPLPDPGVEIGLPAWAFGQCTLQPLENGRLLALGIRNGLNETLLFEEGAWRKLELGAPVNVPQAYGESFAWIDAPSDASPAIATGSSGEEIVRHRRAIEFPPGIGAKDCAVPEALDFETADGSTAHALFYHPVNAHHALQPGEKPPLVVMVHGGPTGRANPAFSFKVQWWTTRGFSVLDVNYRGSTGFGRAYRQALDGQWGVADVEDCICAVRAVLARGLADPKRCVIRGSSAGGLTVLQSLAQSDLFAAGTSLYGVTDLRALAHDTHKFESRYLDRLIGPYPQDEALYLQRSPITHANRITAPVLFLHGSEDKVVPLSQAKEMVQKLRANGQNPELHVYQGEGHGFRQEATLVDSFERELRFYQKVFSTASE